MVLEIEDSRESRAVPQRIFPGAVGTLAVDEEAHTLLDGRAVRTPHREEAEERPGGLARDGLTTSGPFVVLVGSERLSPATVGVLPLLEPPDGPLHVVLAVILTDGPEATQDGPGSVHVVHAPPSVPGAALVLTPLDEAQRALGGRMLQAVAERAQELEAASREVLRGGVEESAVIGERDIVEDHPIVVGVEGGPASVVALHPEEPRQPAFDAAVAPLGVQSARLGERHHHHGGVIEVGIEVVVILE